MSGARVVEVLAGHRLNHKRPAQPGPGEAWTCTCGVFRVSQAAQDAHDAHIADVLAPVIREMQAAAWDEGHRTGWHNRRDRVTKSPEPHAKHNPYRVAPAGGEG